MTREELLALAERLLRFPHPTDCDVTHEAAAALRQIAEAMETHVLVPRDVLVEIARGKMPEDYGRLDVTAARLSGIARDLLAAAQQGKE